MTDIFVSYAREDKEFVVQLVDAFKADGREVWVDFQDIPFATDWWEEIQNGIDAAESAIFVISPDSLESRYCGLEVNYAVKNNKRLIPVLYRPSNGLETPKEIATLNWIFFEDPLVFNQAVAQLLSTVDRDVEALRQHTRLLIRAKEWEKKGHSRSLLLRDTELTEFDNIDHQLNLTSLQDDFLRESQQRRRQVEIFWRFVFGFIGGFLGMGFWAFSTFNSEQLITPLRLIYMISLGEVFGLFIGILSILAGELPLQIQQTFSRPVLLALRIGLCVVIGVVAWTVFRWFYLAEASNLTPESTRTLVFAGVGLGLGFIVRILFKLPGWLAALITAIAIYVPIYVFYEGYFTGSGQVEPLIYFRAFEQIYSVGIPIVIFIALGANAQAIRREAHAAYRKFIS